MKNSSSHDSQVSSFHEMARRLQKRDSAAENQIFQRYVHRLVALARSRLQATMRPKVDAEDVAQSVLKSFFQRHREGQLQLTDWESLWSLLAVITMRKCGRLAAYYRAGVRDVRRETPQPDSSQSPECAVEALTPNPEEAVMLVDIVEEVMQGLEPADREIVTLTLQGYLIREISAEVDRSESTVRRILNRVRRHLERHFMEGEE